MVKNDIEVLEKGANNRNKIICVVHAYILSMHNTYNLVSVVSAFFECLNIILYHSFQLYSGQSRLQFRQLSLCLDWEFLTVVAGINGVVVALV